VESLERQLQNSGGRIREAELRSQEVQELQNGLTDQARLRVSQVWRVVPGSDGASP
jgi:hypothetical protein